MLNGKTSLYDLLNNGYITDWRFNEVVLCFFEF
jgi:hypothetical protein